MRTTLKKILVPTDFTPTSKVAIMQGAHLAKIMGAELHLIHVLELPFIKTNDKLRFSVLTPGIKSIKKKAKKQLEIIQTKIYKEYNISPWAYVIKGKVDTVIHDFVRIEHIDLIIMGAHGISGYKEFVLGSNTNKVVSGSKIPVLTFRTGDLNINFKNILLPIDNLHNNLEKINAIVGIAKAYDSTIHLLGVPEQVTRETINKLVLIIESLEGYLDSHRIQHKTKIIAGLSLAKASMNYLKRNPCHLIVVDDYHKKNIKDYTGGVFPKKIINHSTIPVLTIKVRDRHYDMPSLIGYGNPMKQ